ncbi:MAG: GNAT family N-acetyltransferase [Chloroflexota bacterium]|nr:GNAT family N-acetyltransferase [Chloroflexota bacterium]MDE2948848.1 GNAT family N-acetyltransferase [Chloroflexota bacterium]
MDKKESDKDLERQIAKMDAALRGDQSEENMAALKQALDQDWPEIQKHLIEEGAKDAAEESGEERDPYEPYWTTNSDGTRTLHMNFDGWWLKHFDRNDVLMELPGIAIMNTKPWHVRSVCISYGEAYGIRDPSDCDDCFTEDDILAHIERFPQGQFAAQRISGPSAGNCVGMATTMRTSRPPTAPILPWMEAIGDLRLSAHEPNGDWFYGVELAVHPMYQRHGIGTGLYEARFRLVRGLNLRGWYAVGMLMGYKDCAEKLDVLEYGEKVIAGKIKDPTVTMQLNRGFRAGGVVTDYVDEPAAGDAGVLIVWENPNYAA